MVEEYNIAVMSLWLSIRGSDGKRSHYAVGGLLLAAYGILGLGIILALLATGLSKAFIHVFFVDSWRTLGGHGLLALFAGVSTFFLRRAVDRAEPGTPQCRRRLLLYRGIAMVLALTGSAVFTWALGLALFTVFHPPPASFALLRWAQIGFFLLAVFRLWR